MDYKKNLPLFLSQGEFKQVEEKGLYKDVSGFEFLQFLIGVEVVLLLDWSGEEDEYQIADFLERRRNLFARPPLKLEKEKVYKKIEKENLQRGEHVSYILKYYQKIMRREGFEILEMPSDGDCYYIVLATRENAQKLKSVKDEFWKFVSFGTLSHEKLYIINCPDCGDTNIWMLPKSDPKPAGGTCEECGKDLFYPDGTSRSEMTEEDM